MKFASASFTCLLLTLLLLLPFTAAPQIVRAQSSVINITSYHVDGAPNYNAAGNETFWKNIAWTNVSLAATVMPGGGHTPYVLVKSANDGFNIYVLFRWVDAQGASYGSSPELYLNSKGQLVPLDPAKTGNVHQLFYNATYYYPDRVAMLWFLNGPRGIVPAMKLNSTGAITNGTANIWHWQSNPTDNSQSDTGFPGGYTDPKGIPIFPPNNSSFAEDDYTNMTGFFPIAGTVSGTPNLDPYADPFTVLAGNNFYQANKTWTVEMVRPLLTPQDRNYRVQLQIGASYFVGFAVWNGRMGESAHIKSVSDWYKLTLTDQASSSLPPTAGGISLTLAAASSFGLLIVGLMIGLLVKPEQKKRNP